MTTLKIYFDDLSQPSRAVRLLLETCKVDYEKCPIKIAEGEHKKSEEFAKINPARLLPALCDDGFCLSESPAILKYIVNKYKLPDHWYPSDIQRRARVDEYLSWHAFNLRRGAGIMLAVKAIFPKLFGTPENPDKVKELQGVLVKSKEMMETYFLKDTKFIAGDEVSIADLQALCEFTQFWMFHVDPTEGYPRLAQWMKDVQAALQPVFEEVHAIVYATRDQGTFKGAL